MSKKKNLDPVNVSSYELVSTEQRENDGLRQIDQIELKDQTEQSADNCSSLDLELNVGELALKLNCQYTGQDMVLAAQIQLLEKDLQSCRLKLLESQQIIGFLQGRILSQQEQIAELELKKRDLI